MGDAAETRVPCSKETRARLRSAKRGHMTFDELFRQMLAQYDPEKGAERSDAVETFKTPA